MKLKISLMLVPYHAKENWTLQIVLIQNGNFHQANRILRTVKPKLHQDSIKYNSLLLNWNLRLL
ncbi:MAG: hypothetical protein IPH96_18005 [Saprospiraceae bacterium]|nr:hypothetical protein [Saprospiraceae bacterium]